MYRFRLSGSVYLLMVFRGLRQKKISTLEASALCERTELCQRRVRNARHWGVGLLTSVAIIVEVRGNRERTVLSCYRHGNTRLSPVSLFSVISSHPAAKQSHRRWWPEGPRSQYSHPRMNSSWRAFILRSRTSPSKPDAQRR